MGMSDPRVLSCARHSGSFFSHAECYQVQYEVKRKLVEVSMRDRRKQQMKERDQMAIDLEAIKEK
jgi:hypothetical protein